MSSAERPTAPRGSPQAAIGRLIQHESERLELRRLELEDAQAVFADYAAEHRAEHASGADAVDYTEVHAALDASLDVIPVERAVGRLRAEIESTTGPIRHVMRSIGTVADSDAGLVRWAQAEVAQGRVLRTIYPSSFLLADNVRGQMRVREWADIGEQQRVLEKAPHAFTVFGDELVVSCSQWGVLTDDLVAIRSPLLVQAFGALFEDAWRAGLPVPLVTYDEDEAADRLLALLASGLKDEAIARYLGVSLRTVRRRVAGLMTELGADTRFQLGSAAQRRGLLSADPD